MAGADLGTSLDGLAATPENGTDWSVPPTRGGYSQDGFMNVADGAASPAGDAEGRPRATDGPGRRRRIGMKAICLLGLALAVTAGLGYGLRPRREAQDALTAGTAPVVRGDLTVTVTEGGYIEPLKSFEVTSKVEGQCTILRLIDEGTLLTEQDVEDGTDQLPERRVLLQAGQRELRDPEEAEREQRSPGRAEREVRPDGA